MDVKYIEIAVNALRKLAEDLKMARMVVMDVSEHLADLTAEAIHEQEQGGE